MIYLDELQDLKLYKKQFLLPRNKKDKRFGRIAVLLTPNIGSSIKTLNHPLMNTKLYESYYVEKDVSALINENRCLEITPNMNYVHETVELPVNEGVFSRGEPPKVIYNGLEKDVRAAKDVINNNGGIYPYEDIVKVKVKTPLSITISRDPSMKEIIKPGMITMLPQDWFGRDEYAMYCKEIICEMTIRCKNPNINSILCDCLCMVMTGTYAKYKDYIFEKSPYLAAVCDYIELSIKKRGERIIPQIIVSNNLPHISKNSIKLKGKEVQIRIKDMLDEMVIITEGELNPVQKLRRSIRFSANKGSKHIVNKIDRLVDRTVDSSVKTPDFTTSDDPNLSNVTPPTVNDIKNQIASKTGGIIPTSSDAGKQEKKSDPDNFEEEYRWFDSGEEVIIEEDYTKYGNCITFFNEAQKNNPVLYKMLYKERLRNNRDVVKIYDDIKEACPNIKYTYLTYRQYKKRNLFIDLSYYTERFFMNNTYQLKKGFDLYLNLLTKMMVEDPRLKKEGYKGEKTLIIPVSDWDLNPNTKMWIYTKSINPISIIYELMRTKSLKLKEIFGDTNVVFLGETGYFKINFKNDYTKSLSKFPILIDRLRNNEHIEDPDMYKDSPNAIRDEIIDRIEDGRDLKIHNLTGASKNLKPEPKIAKDSTTNSRKIPKEEPIKKGDIDKEDIVGLVNRAAATSKSVDDALEQLDDEYFKGLIADLDQEEAYGPKLTAARKRRFNTLAGEILNKKVKNTPIKDLLTKREEFSNKPLDPKSIPIDSINPEWKELKYAAFSDQYNIDADIVAVFTSLNKMSYPIGIISIDAIDNSTTEDYIKTYVVKMENHEGKRFTIKLDIPIMVDNKYMMLRGNKKVISMQSFLMPIIKTDPDTVQIISNYNKIFISVYNNTIGKSNSVADRLIKILRKNTYTGVKVDWTPCDATNRVYDLPIDYLDFSSVMRQIETPHNVICFDMRWMKSEFKDKIDPKKGVPIGWTKDKKNLIYCDNGACSDQVYFILTEMQSASSKQINEDFMSCPQSSKHAYSKASILNVNIPVIVIAAYSEGLTTVLEKAKVGYNLIEKKPSKKDRLFNQDYIKFADGFIQYAVNPRSSLLMNGLKECPTEMYSIKDINNRTMYLEFLDGFGGRLKADGLDNFYDCMVDPITEDTLKHYNMPTDYVSILLYANDLLQDTAYYSHGKQEVRRLRKNEIISGYTYKAVALAYGQYSTSLKHGRSVPMTIKQSAVIDYILLDPTAGDLSIINALNEYESYNQVSTKGLSGMNSDRAYSLDKRSFDDSMLNVLSMSTGFAATVGINRQATLNASIDTARGYIKPSSEKDANSINSLCMSEALTPMGTTRDDPFRSAMTFIQTTRHTLISDKSDPLLVTNGADEAMPYLISDVFCHKAKGKGVVKVVEPGQYMIIKYDDSEEAEYIDISDKVEKNSSSGFYVTIKMTTNLKVGDKVKEGDIVAYDKGSFSPKVGFNNNIAYKVGTLAKVAMMDTDEGFEDSAITSEALAQALTSDIIKKKEINIPANTNVYNLIEPGTPVEEGDTLLIMQSSYDEADATTLLKNLAGDEEDISDLGRIPIKSAVTGWIQDVEVCRTVDLDELTDSLRKICVKYENKIKKKKTVAKENGVPENIRNRIGADYKLSPTGRMKDAPDGVKITIHMAYKDKYSVGDKLVYWSANKGVCKDHFPVGLEPYSMDRPNEKIHALVAIASVNGRMVTSIQNIGIINRLLIEASRKAKDMCGIEYNENLLELDENGNLKL